MLIHNRFKDNLLRLALLLCGLYCLGGSLRYVLSRHPFGLGLMIADILFQLFLAFVCFSLVYLRPAVELTREGIRVRRLLKWRAYTWDSIPQAGILWQYGIRRHNTLVLVQPGGSVRHFRDRSFQLRNYGRLVYLPCKDKALQYTLSCRGKLNFNLADGQPDREV